MGGLGSCLGAVGRADRDSDFIIRVARIKVSSLTFTSGNAGKLTRVASARDVHSPSKQGSGFMAFACMADFAVQTWVCGGSGIVRGRANTMPKIIVKVWNVWTDGKTEEATKLQAVVSSGDWLLNYVGMSGTKAARRRFSGAGVDVREALRKVGDAEAESLAEKIEEVDRH